MLWILVYEIVGIILIWCVSFIHVCIALKKGYAIKTIISVADCLNSSNSAFNVILGCMIWPVRIIQFICSQKYLFDMYKLFEKINLKK